MLLLVEEVLFRDWEEAIDRFAEGVGGYTPHCVYITFGKFITFFMCCLKSAIFLDHLLVNFTWYQRSLITW